MSLYPVSGSCSFGEIRYYMMYFSWIKDFQGKSEAECARLCCNDGSCSGYNYYNPYGMGWCYLIEDMDGPTTTSKMDTWKNVRRVVTK